MQVKCSVLCAQTRQTLSAGAAAIRGQHFEALPNTPVWHLEAGKVRELGGCHVPGGSVMQGGFVCLLVL